MTVEQIHYQILSKQEKKKKKRLEVAPPTKVDDMGRADSPLVEEAPEVAIISDM